MYHSSEKAECHLLSDVICDLVVCVYIVFCVDWHDVMYLAVRSNWIMLKPCVQGRRERGAGGGGKLPLAPRNVLLGPSDFFG